MALLDFNMPGKNGVELAAELRKARPALPIALITANIQNEVIDSAKAVGATFVAKPVTQEGLAGVPDRSGANAEQRKSVMSLEVERGRADTITLTELERDALAELANIGVSRAAASLRKMVGQQVMLSVPSVEVVSQKTAGALVAEREGNNLVAVQQEFAGAFSGRAMLIFPQAKSLELIRAIVGSEVAAEDAKDIEEEALAETGNVILNGCLATMANILHQSLTVSLPQVRRGTGARLFKLNETSTDSGLVLFLYINFSILDLDIRGYIAMLMDLPSLENLKVLLGEFIASVMDENPDKRRASTSGRWNRCVKTSHGQCNQEQRGSAVREFASVAGPMFQALAGYPMALTVSDVRAAGAPIIFSNAAFSELTGYSAEETLGRASASSSDRRQIIASASELVAAFGDGRSVRSRGPHLQAGWQAVLEWRLGQSRDRRTARPAFVVVDPHRRHGRDEES